MGAFVSSRNDLQIQNEGEPMSQHDGNLIRRRSIIQGVGASVSLISFPFINSAISQTLTPITMAIQWVPRGEYATYYMAREKGYYKERGFDVTFKHMLGNALAFQALSSGNADIIHADLLQMLMLQGRAPDPQMRSLAVVGDKLNISLFFQKGKGINKPSDLENRTIVDSPGSTAPAMYKIFAKANGFDPNKTVWKNAAGNAKVALMLQGEADAVAIGLPAKPSIDSKLPNGQEIGFFTFGDHGVNVYGDGLITTEKNWRERPDAMKAFVQATMKGCKDAFADPVAGAASMVKHYPEMDRALSVKELDLIRDVAIGKTQKEKGLGFHDPVKFKATHDVVTGLLGQPIAKPSTDFFTNAAFT